MPIQDQVLWNRINTYAFAKTGPIGVLLRRLHVGTTEGYRADLIIADYRRFLFLLATAGNTLLPPPAVSTVWRMHARNADGEYDQLGDMIGHPMPQPGTKQFRPNASEYLLAKKYYRDVFDMEPNLKIWPTKHSIVRTNLLSGGALVAFCLFIWTGFHINGKHGVPIISSVGAYISITLVTWLSLMIWSSLSTYWRLGRSTRGGYSAGSSDTSDSRDDDGDDGDGGDNCDDGGDGGGD